MPDGFIEMHFYKLEPSTGGKGTKIYMVNFKF